jgi:hypothetical protein
MAEVNKKETEAKKAVENLTNASETEVEPKKKKTSKKETQVN